MPRLLAALALVLAALAGATSPTVARAADPVRLSIAPVGVPAGAPVSYFTLTASPGESARMTVQLGNGGAATVSARTFAADAYTIPNGGFGVRLDGEPTSGATMWLDYLPQTLDLGPGASVQRSFIVTVPAAAQPGEYLTGLVIQNAEPVSDQGSLGEVGVAFLQVNRQAIAVSITVPGVLAPRLEIGAATHHTVGGKSSVTVVVRNTGNVRLTPSGELVLRDLTGAEISRFPFQMDSFYAGTDTSVEVPYAAQLKAGEYTVSLSLAATAAGVGVTVQSAPLPMIVRAVEDSVPPSPVGAPGVVPQLAAVRQEPPAAAMPQPAIPPETVGSTTSLPWAWAAGGIALLIVAVGAGAGFGLVVTRRSPASPA